MGQTLAGLKTSKYPLASSIAWGRKTLELKDLTACLRSSVTLDQVGRLVVEQRVKTNIYSFDDYLD